VKPINQYATLFDFTTDLDQKGPLVPFKIMGQKRSNVFYSISMLTEIYRKIDDPDRMVPFRTIDAPFGEILARGVRLHHDLTYSTIVPHKDGQNHFQGDIIELDLSGNGKRWPSHKYAMILSHSCDIPKLSHTIIAPVYLESELTNSAITALREGKAPKSAQEGKQFVNTWHSNGMACYLGLPATDISNAPGGERLIVCLHLSTSIPKKNAQSNPAQLRLKYRALSYLQSRLAVLFMRDVQKSDETREI